MLQPYCYSEAAGRARCFNCRLLAEARPSLHPSLYFTTSHETQSLPQNNPSIIHTPASTPSYFYNPVSQYFYQPYAMSVPPLIDDEYEEFKKASIMYQPPETIVCCLSYLATRPTD